MKKLFVLAFSVLMVAISIGGCGGNSNADGVCLRIFQNGVEKNWIGDGINIGGLSQDVKVTFQQELNVRKGDQIMFAVNPERNDSWDGGRLSIVINPK